MRKILFVIMALLATSCTKITMTPAQHEALSAMAEDAEGVCRDHGGVESVDVIKGGFVLAFLTGVGTAEEDYDREYTVTCKDGFGGDRKSPLSPEDFRLDVRARGGALVFIDYDRESLAIISRSFEAGQNVCLQHGGLKKISYTAPQEAPYFGLGELGYIVTGNMQESSLRLTCNNDLSGYLDKMSPPSKDE